MSDTGINAAMLAEENDAAETVRPHSHAAIKPGVQLAKQRELLGWSVEQVAEQLKLAPRQVTALEADDYAALPGLAVVRGFIRAYAKILKIDASPLVSMIEVETVAPKEPMPLRSDLSSKFSNSGMPLMGKRGTPMTWVGLAVVAVLVLVLGGQQMGWMPPAGTWLKAPGAAPSASAIAASADLTVGGVDPAPAVAPESAAPASAAGTMAVADEHDLKAATPPAVTATPIAPAPVTPTPAARANDAVLPRIDATVPGLADAKRAMQTPTPTPTPAAVVAAPPVKSAAPASVPANATAANATAANAPATNKAVAGPSTGALVFSAHQDTWVEVKRANGTIVISRLLKAGSTETVALDGPVVLVVGNVAGLDATLRGTPLSLQSPTGGNTARLNLK